MLKFGMQIIILPNDQIHKSRETVARDYQNGDRPAVRQVQCDTVSQQKSWLGIIFLVISSVNWLFF